VNEPKTKQKTICDGSGQDNQQLARDLEDSMGYFALSNIWSINNLKQIIQHKNDEIILLQDKLKQKEKLIEK
jgi:hypothetical protein